MADKDLSVLIAVLEGLTKTCADLVLEVRGLRQVIDDKGLVPGPAAQAPGPAAEAPQSVPAAPVAPRPKPAPAAPVAPRPKPAPAPEQTASKPSEPAVSKPAGKAAGQTKEAPPQEIPSKASDSPVAAWLENRGFRVVRHGVGNGQDKMLIPLALEMGDHFDELRPVHDAIRAAQADGSEFSVSLKDKDGSAVSRCVQWAGKLGKRGLLSDVHYARKGRTLSARTQAGGVAQSFFSGRWFELYVRAKVERVLTAQKLQFDSLTNICIRLPDGQNRELDLLFIVEQEPIWIECKSGGVRGQLKRIGKLRMQLQIAPDRSILAVLDMPPEVGPRNRRPWGLAVADLEAVDAAVLRALGLCAQEAAALLPTLTDDELAAMAAFRPTPGGSVPEGGLSKLLTRKSLPPLPEQRQAVLAAMPPLMQKAKGEVTGEDLATRLQPSFADLSVANLKGIVQAAMRGGGLPDEDGIPVKSLKTPLGHELPTPEDLDASCRRAYAAAVLNTDVDWLQSEDHQKELVEAVGGPLPPAEHLAQIREQIAKRLSKTAVEA